MIVIDSSAVVNLLIGESNAARIASLIEREETHAPHLIGFEVLSAIRGQVRGAKMTSVDAMQTMRDYMDLEDRLELWPLSDALNERVLELRDNVTAYDSCYVAMAELFGCPFVTSDAKLVRTSGHHAEIVLV